MGEEQAGYDPTMGAYHDPTLGTYYTPDMPPPGLLEMGPLGHVFVWIMWARVVLAPVFLLFGAWMAVDCFRQGRPYYWYWIIFATGGMGAVIYWFVFNWETSFINKRLIRRAMLSRRLNELKAKVFHIDNAHHRIELGDVYLKLEKWDEARAMYEEALARDPADAEARAHLAYALLALARPRDAWPHFDAALDAKPDMEYGELKLQAARCLVALDYKSEAADLYLDVLRERSHAKASVEAADLLTELGRFEGARALLVRTVADAHHGPAYIRRRDAPHVRRARKRLRALEKLHPEEAGAGV